MASAATAPPAITAFETLGCIRVELKTDALNVKSRQALARIGAVEEGTFRDHMVMPDGHLRDSVYFSIIASQWPAVKAHLERLMAAHRGEAYTENMLQQ